MKTYPLKSLSLDQAKDFQFRLVDEITKVFDGGEVLELGDLGVVQPANQPSKTIKVEKVLANFFSVEAAILLRGSGTGAIREALAALAGEKRKVLVHTSPIYSTTATSFQQLNYEIVRADFNDLEALRKSLDENTDLSCALVQYTRQTLDDSYDMGQVIDIIKEKNIPIITDDNYAVMKVEKTGVELGADLSCFSIFKLLGPQGIGCVIGKKEYIDKIRAFHYSGGSQVQGFEAMDALRSLVYAPVSLAIQAEESEKIVKFLNEEGLQGIKSAVIANSQSKVILVEFTDEIAEKVLEESKKLGAASHPVGSESRYEFVPMFYRVSGTMRAQDPSASKRWIRINPMRSGSQTVIRILKEALEKVSLCS